MVLRPKEDEPVPPCACDRAGDRRERFVRATLILKILATHRHAVLDTLPFANQPRTGNRAIIHRPPPAHGVAAVEVLGNRLEPFDRLGLQSAVRQLLNAIGEPAFEETAVYGGGSVSNRSRHIALSAGVGVVFSAATRASTQSLILRPHRVLGGHVTALVGRVVEANFSAVAR